MKKAYFLLLLLLFLPLLVFSSGWHPANEVLSGDFEGTYNFTDTICIRGDCRIEWPDVSGAETDPIYSGDPASGITSSDISNWDSAYSWGDHASEGYLKSFTETDPQVGSLTSGKWCRSDGSSVICDVDVVNDTNSGGDITGVAAGTGLTGGGTSGNVTLGIHTSNWDDITVRASSSTGTGSGFYQTNSATTAEGWPEDDGGWYHLLNVQHNNVENNYAMQFAGDYQDQDLFYRSTNDDGTQAWGRVWTSLTDGSGSGLDADLLDGINSASFLRSDTDDEVSNAGVEISFHSNDEIEAGTGDHATLEVYQDTGGADAFMQFHVEGDYGVNFGLDGSTNDLVVGGWSMGNGVKHRIWHAGNDGTGSGLDADLLDGLDSSKFVVRSLSSYDFDDVLNSADIPSGLSNIYTDVGVSPGGSWGTGLTVKSVTNRGFQLGVSHVQEEIYFRNTNSDGNSWQDWRELWHSGNDGTGSGLDADMLDGQHASAFASSSDLGNYVLKSGDTMSGNLNVNALIYANYAVFKPQDTGNEGGEVSFEGAGSNSDIRIDNYAGHFRIVTGSTPSEVFRITEGGKVGILTGSPITQLDVVGNTRTTGSYQVASGNGNGYKFWDSDAYKIYMSGSVDTTWGGKLDGDSDYNMYFKMQGGTDRGFVFKNGDTPVAQIDGKGRVYAKDGFHVVRKDDISTRTNSGFYETSTATHAEGWPLDDDGWMHMISSTHSSESSYYSMQLASDFNSQDDLYFRATSDDGNKAWSEVWTSSSDGSGSGLDADTVDGYTPVNKAGDSMTGKLSVSTNLHSSIQSTTTSSTSGSTGVYGGATATTGNTYGVMGHSYSDSGRGVYGYNIASSGTTYGVYGSVNSASGFGLYTPNRVGASQYCDENGANCIDIANVGNKITTYEYWGSSSCSAGDTELYDGYAANIRGSVAGDTKCVDDSALTDGSGGYAHERLYVAWNSTVIQGASNDAIVCSVCETSGSVCVPIFGSSSCPSGYTKKYDGYTSLIFSESSDGGGGAVKCLEDSYEDNLSTTHTYVDFAVNWGEISSDVKGQRGTIGCAVCCK